MDQTVAVALLDVRRIELGQVPQLVLKPAVERRKKRKRKSVSGAHSSPSSSIEEKEEKITYQQLASCVNKTIPERNIIRNNVRYGNRRYIRNIGGCRTMHPKHTRSDKQDETDLLNDESIVLCMSSPEEKQSPDESYQHLSIRLANQRFPKCNPDGLIWKAKDGEPTHSVEQVDGNVL
jgi:hypothetical protein